jgi:hypothetical protein
MNATPTPLAGLARLEQYQAGRSHVFPGIESLRWYLRQHRTGLEGAAALLYIAGRLWIDVDKFDTYVLDAGSRDSKRRAAA